MNNCPNCGKQIDMRQASCECGEFLRPEATHHSHAWETETVFRPKKRVNGNFVAAASVVFVVVVIMLALAWPQFSRSDKSVQTGPDLNSSQTESGSDIVPSSDIVWTENNDESVTQEGVFNFSTGSEQTRTLKARSTVRPLTEAKVEQQVSASTESSNDAQLLSGKASENQKAVDEKSLSDCKPAITASLTRPEPVQENDKPRPQPKQSSISYILGPRGGCFFVTATGSKKYVDHSLCGASNAAAARQD